ncbi:MAG: phenylacetate--CoA ligase family protein, partial [Gemmataceae bacterium]
AELAADQASAPPYGTNLTYPVEACTRLHQTSGTSSGQPLRWLDTAASWQNLLECWHTMFRMVEVGPGDRLFFPFSFGPFLGFWTAFEAAQQIGALCLSGGGMSSSARLRFLLDNRATVVLCTPTYALRLAEAANAEGASLQASPVRMLIVAGEPGGSISTTRTRIESAWGARLIDHNGLTEVGPVGIECLPAPGGLHLLESDYIAEVIDPASGQTLPVGQVGELVLSNLRRTGSPLLRYRTGDLVKLAALPCPCGRALVRLEGGILGRVDDMIHVRGNNVYPSALEAVLRRFTEVNEFRVEIEEAANLSRVEIQLELREGAARGDLGSRVEQAIRDELMFRAEIRLLDAGTLPRFEMKSQRFVRKE